MATLDLGGLLAFSRPEDAEVEGRLGAAMLGGGGWGQGREDG